MNRFTAYSSEWRFSLSTIFQYHLNLAVPKLHIFVTVPLICQVHFGVCFLEVLNWKKKWWLQECFEKTAIGGLAHSLTSWQGGTHPKWNKGGQLVPGTRWHYSCWWFHYSVYLRRHLSERECSGHSGCGFWYFSTVTWIGAPLWP